MCGASPIPYAIWHVLLVYVDFWCVMSVRVSSLQSFLSPVGVVAAGVAVVVVVVGAAVIVCVVSVPFLLAVVVVVVLVGVVVGGVVVGLWAVS